MTTLGTAGPFTRADLDALPDDGRRHELIDGALVVTPAPAIRHQRVAGRLYVALTAACTPGLEVLYAPVDVVLADDTVLQPDLLVAAERDLTAASLTAAPRLAIEVLSPSTRRIDLTVKLDRYASAGTPSYWVVDPVELSLTAWELSDGRYGEARHVVGSDVYETTSPFPLTIVPEQLWG